MVNNYCMQFAAVIFQCIGLAALENADNFLFLQMAGYRLPEMTMREEDIQYRIDNICRIDNIQNRQYTE